MKKLPLNKNDFKEIITGDYLYVDKTYIFFHIFKNYDIYFLMRPSGFGKTLFLSTLRYYLSGEGSLFQGLAIGGDVLFKSAEPLIFLDFNPEDSATLEDNTLAKIKTSAELNGINIQEKASHLALAELIKGMANKYSKKVSILIDNCDGPVRFQHHSPTLLETNTKILNSFYSQIRELRDAFISFAFIVGENQVPGCGSASVFESFKDISFAGEFGEICGVTRYDLSSYFNDYLTSDSIISTPKGKDLTPAGLQDEIIKWYNGYSFDGQKKVINPTSLLRFFASGKFQEYYTQNPQLYYLVSSVIEGGLSLKGDFGALSERKTRKELVNSDFGDPLAMLFQSGFLTLDVEDDAPRIITSYKLKIPNLEIKNSLERLMKV